MAGSKSRNIYRLLLAASVVTFAGCGTPSQQAPSGAFAGKAIRDNSNAGSAIAVGSVTLAPSQLTAGKTAQVTVHLTAAAPNGGVTVQLGTSDESVVTTPVDVIVPAGWSSASATAATHSVKASTQVAISAIYNSTVASAVLTVNPAASAPFTISVQPSTLTESPGQSASVKIATKISAGYDHSLQLKDSNLPAGVSLAFNPSTIPAPGDGTSDATITIPSDLKPGTYSIHVTATDGTTSEGTTLTLKVSDSPGATFQGCWYKQNGFRYQGVKLAVANPGTYPFDADLYYGPTCDPNHQADEFGFGTPLNFGSFDYIFWFTAFPGQTDMSAVWHVGADQSQCVNYKVAPSCE
jgi:hypothetical protein